MSELFRIVIVMERRGWLQKDPETARYRLTYHVLRVAYRGTPTQTLTGAASAVMHDLSIRINQSCHLVVRSGAQGLVILRHENQVRHANLSVRLGATIDLLTSCSGHVLLAHLGVGDRDRLIESLSKPQRAAFAKLTKSLDLIRNRGFEVQKSPMTAGVTDISCPVRGFDGEVSAALTVPYLHVLDRSLPLTVEQTRRALGDAARKISQSLGWDP